MDWWIDRKDDEAYTQQSALNPTGLDRIRLPDVSGTVNLTKDIWIDT